MKTQALLAKHLRELHFGSNWTGSNLKAQLSDISWQEATSQVYDLNSIATLAFHINYYIDAVIKVLEGGALIAKDELSFNGPTIASQKDWEHFLDKFMTDAETFAQLIEALPESQLLAQFTDEKYGDYYRNLQGIIEHSHYHLGQIALIKKILRSRRSTASIH